jgi:hypothetical protein
MRLRTFLFTVGHEHNREPAASEYGEPIGWPRRSNRKQLTHATSNFDIIPVYYCGSEARSNRSVSANPPGDPIS